jgi:hypothetical protein
MKKSVIEERELPSASTLEKVEKPHIDPDCGMKATPKRGYSVSTR